MTGTFYSCAHTSVCEVTRKLLRVLHGRNMVTQHSTLSVDIQALRKPHLSFSTLLVLHFSSNSIAISRVRDTRIREWIECDG